MIKRVYIDNSVIGGAHDIEFAKFSNLLFREFKSGIYRPVISNITKDEISGTPKEVLKTFSHLEKISEYIELNEEAVVLSSEYIKAGKFTQRMRADMLHIALASVFHIEILVSWNFRDIVNLNKIVVYNSVNHKLGYPVVEIRTPREIIHD